MHIFRFRKGRVEVMLIAFAVCRASPPMIRSWPNGLFGFGLLSCAGLVGRFVYTNFELNVLCLLCTQFGRSLALSGLLVLDLRIPNDHDEDGNHAYDDYDDDYGNGVLRC